MRPFFVIGPPKTGTTVFTRLLVQHPEVDCLSETALPVPDDPSSLLHAGGEKAAQHGLSTGETTVWASAMRAARTPAARRAVVDSVLARYAAGRPLRAIGDSWPFWGQHLAWLVEAYPDARFLHTTRDPRAVYAAKDTLGRDRRMEFLSWLLACDRAVLDALGGRPNLHVVRYEALLEDPERVMRETWAFLGVDPASGWIGYDPARDAHPQRWAWIANATAPLDASRASRWATALSPPETRAVRVAAGAYAARHGYVLEAGPAPSVAELLGAFVMGAPLRELDGLTESDLRHAFRASLRPRA